MDGIAGISHRMLEIESMLSSFSRPTSAQATAVRTNAASFDAALGKAVDATSPTLPAESSAPVWSAAGIPADLEKYGNGKIPAEALTEISGSNHRLWAPATSAFEQLRADAAKDGITIGITDSYRSYESQVDVAERKGLYKNGGLAAVPGTSPHGWGVALDLKLDGDAQAWMRANGGRYGFVEDTPREPWHWVYKK